MILSVQRQVHDAISDAIRRQFGVADPPPFAIEVPPNRALGDLAVAVAFQLARTLRKAPRAIAQELAGALDGHSRHFARRRCAERISESLSRSTGVPARARRAARCRPLPRGRRKTIVEHTAINPNKAAHIGHLRNAALGDTLVRVLAFRGTPVEVQNYIDDLGVQVADIIVGFRELEQKSIDDIRAIADTTRFDYYCWDLYSRVTEWYDGDPARLAVRAAALHDLEHGDNATAEMGAFIVDRIVRTHLRTMARLNIEYDLLTYEGDIVRLHFWSQAFEILKAQGAVFLQTEGKLAGCWVMRIEEGSAGEVPGADIRRAGDDRTEEASREKVIVRSNGVVTYVGKDIANQFWKFGLLGRDFRYRRFGTQPDGRAALVDDSQRRRSGGSAIRQAQRIYNVIDSRQMYLQALLSQALRDARPPEGGGQLDPFLVRDGGAVARHRARAGLRDLRRRMQRSRSSRCPAARGWA